MTEQIKNGTIARIEVTRGTLTEYPLAEKVRGGWQNGVTSYPDDEVTKVGARYACFPGVAGAGRGDQG